MEIRIILLITLLFCNSNARSGQFRAYFSKEPSFLSRGQLVIDGQEFKTKFMTEKFEISNSMKSNPEAFRAATNHELYMDRSSLYLWGGLGLAITYLLAKGKDYNKTVYWGVFGTGLGMSLYERSKGNEELRKAITLYNKEF